MTFLERAITDGHAKLTGEGKQQKILYVAVNHTERYADPEEQVRAEFWAELIYRYGYEPARIGVEITVPDRTPSDRADFSLSASTGERAGVRCRSLQLAERKKPYAVIECKADGVTDAEFNQAVEQACGNGTWAKFRANYVGVVAGMTRRLWFLREIRRLEREANIIADLPRQYGKPEEYRFYKGDPNNDIQPVSKEALIGAIKKCHQTLWAGGKLSPPAAFGELCKIIFVKISDEQAKRKKGEPYEFQIKTHEPSRRRRDGWGTVFVMGNAVRRRHTCAMKTTGYVRKSAVEQGVSEGKSLKCGAQEKSKVFAERMRNYTQRLEFSKNLL